MLKRLKTLLMWGDRSPHARRHQLFCLACALIILGCVAYVAGYFAEQGRVRREGEVYRAMYSPAPLETEAPAATATAMPTAIPTATSTVVPTAAVSPTPAATATAAGSPTPTACGSKPRSAG